MIASPEAGPHLLTTTLLPSWALLRTTIRWAEAGLAETALAPTVGA